MIFKVVLLVALAGVASAGYTFPDDFKTCKADTSSNSSCLVDLIQDTYTKLGTKGISSPINFSINPVTQPWWNFHVQVPTVDNHEYFWNLTHPTIWQATVQSASFDASSLTLTYTTFQEDFQQFVTKYEIWGQLFSENGESEIVYGTGPVNKHIYNLTLEHTIVFVPGVVKDVDHFFVGTYNISVKTVTGAYFNYQNLYDGDEVRAEKGKGVMNDHALEIVLQQAGPLSSLLVNMFEIYTQRLVNSVPASKILEHLAGK